MNALAFAEPATEEQLQRAATTLREHGMTVEIVDTPEDARVLLEEILPRDQAIFTATSETLQPPASRPSSRSPVVSSRSWACRRLGPVADPSAIRATDSPRHGATTDAAAERRLESPGVYPIGLTHDEDRASPFQGLEAG